MSGNESGFSDREKSPFLIRTSNDQRRRSKEVSPKAGEPPKEHSKRKRPKSHRITSSDRSTDKERIPSPKRRSKNSKKRGQFRSKENKKKKHQR